jgi:hypothetical protein
VDVYCTVCACFQEWISAECSNVPVPLIFFSGTQCFSLNSTLALQGRTRKCAQAVIENSSSIMYTLYRYNYLLFFSVQISHNVL